MPTGGIIPPQNPTLVAKNATRVGHPKNSTSVDVGGTNVGHPPCALAQKICILSDTIYLRNGMLEILRNKHFDIQFESHAAAILEIELSTGSH